MYIKTSTMYGRHTVTETRTPSRSEPNKFKMIGPLQVEVLSSSEEACELLFDDTAEPYEASAPTCAERTNYFHGKNDEANLTENGMVDVSVSVFEAGTRELDIPKGDQEFTTTATTGTYPEPIHTYTETILYDGEEAFFILCEDTEEIPSKEFDETGGQDTDLILNDHTPCTRVRSNVEKPAISSQVQQTTDTESDSSTLTTNEIPTVSEQDKEADYLSDNVEELCPQDIWQRSELALKDDLTEGQAKDTSQERLKATDDDFKVTDNTTESSDLESLIPELEKHLKETEDRLLKSQEHFLNILDGQEKDPSFLISPPSLSQKPDEKYDSTLAEYSGQATNNNIFTPPNSLQNKTVTETLADVDEIFCIKGTDEGSEEDMVPIKSSLRCAANPQSTLKKRVRFSQKLIIELDKFGNFQNSKVMDISEGTPIEKLSGTFDDICYKGRTFFRKAVFKTDFNDNTDEFKPPVIQRRGRKNRWRRKGASLSASRKQLVYSAQSVGTLWL